MKYLILLSFLFAGCYTTAYVPEPVHVVYVQHPYVRPLYPYGYYYHPHKVYYQPPQIRQLGTPHYPINRRRH